jgi:predicted dehydrogenase
MSMSRPFPQRVLICGLGSIGQRYCRLIHSEWPSIKLAALRSGINSNSPSIDGIDAVFTTADRALGWKPDVVIVASPASVHLDQALQFASREIPVLIEKPVGVGTEPKETWDELLRLAQSVPICVGYVLRHDPCAAFIRERLESCALGKLLVADFYCGSWLPAWRPQQDYRKTVSARQELGGGVMLELSHEIDMAQWLLGRLEPVSSIIRRSGLLDIDVEDQAVMLLRTEDSTTVSIRLDFCTVPVKRCTMLRGDEAELLWDLVDGVVTITQSDQSRKAIKLGISTDELFLKQLRAFWSLPDGSNSSLCTLSESLDVLSIINQAQLLNASCRDRM